MRIHDVFALNIAVKAINDVLAHHNYVLDVKKLFHRTVENKNSNSDKKLFDKNLEDHNTYICSVSIKYQCCELLIKSYTDFVERQETGFLIIREVIELDE